MQNVNPIAAIFNSIIDLFSATTNINNKISNSIREHFANEDIYLDNTYFNFAVNLIRKAGFCLAIVGLVIAFIDVSTSHSATISVLLALSGYGILIYPMLILGPIIVGIGLQIVACMIYNFAARLHQLRYFSTYQAITNGDLLSRSLENRIQTIQRTLAILETGHLSKQEQAYSQALKKELYTLTDQLTNNSPNRTKCDIFRTLLQENITNYIEQQKNNLSDKEISELQTIGSTIRPKDMIKDIKIVEKNYPELYNQFTKSLGLSAYFNKITPTDIPNELDKLTQTSLQDDYNKAVKLQSIVSDIVTNQSEAKLNSDKLASYMANSVSQDSTQGTYNNDNQDRVQQQLLKSIDDLKNKSSQKERFFYSTQFANIVLFSYKCLDMLSLGLLTFIIGLVQSILEQAGITPESLQFRNVLSLPKIVNKETINHYNKITQLATLRAKHDENDLQEFLLTIETAQHTGNKFVSYLEKKAAKSNTVDKLQLANCLLDLKSIDIYQKHDAYIKKTIQSISAAVSELRINQQTRNLGDILSQLAQNNAPNTELNTLLNTFYTHTTAKQIQLLNAHTKTTETKQTKRKIAVLLRKYNKLMGTGQSKKQSIKCLSPAEQKQFIIDANQYLNTLPIEQIQELRTLTINLRTFSNQKKNELHLTLKNLNELQPSDDLAALKSTMDIIKATQSFLPRAQFHDKLVNLEKQIQTYIKKHKLEERLKLVDKLQQQKRELTQLNQNPCKRQDLETIHTLNNRINENQNKLNLIKNKSAKPS